MSLAPSRWRLVRSRASVLAPGVEAEASGVTLVAPQVKLMAPRGQGVAPDLKLASRQVGALSGTWTGRFV